MKHSFSSFFLVTSVSAVLMSCAESVKIKSSFFDRKHQSSHEIVTTPDTPSADRTYTDLELPAAQQRLPEQILRRTAYTVSYNRDTRQPNWVAWHLTAEHVDGPYKRKGQKFREDEEVDLPRAIDRDYVNSRFDRGHMCPSGDCRWSEDAQRESFLLTNVCPQSHGLNAGDWNEMEQACRRWAERYGSLYIVCGPLFYKNSHRTIGKNRVAVPDAFFKVVLRLGESPCAIGFIYKNEPGNRPKGDYVNTVDEVERITGFDFFPALDDKVEDKIEGVADIDDWQ